MLNKEKNFIRLKGEENMKKIRRAFKHSMSMLLLIVFFGMICSSFASAQEGEHSIYNALNAELISAEFISTGSASGHIADLVVTGAYDGITLNLAESGLNGMVLVNSAEDEQDEVIVDTPGTSTGPGDTTYTPAPNVTLNSGDSKTIPVIGYCINYDKANPTNGTIFTLSHISGKTNITYLPYVLELVNWYYDNGVVPNLSWYDYDFSPQEIHNVFQVAIWAALPENANVTLAEYTARGYNLNDNQIAAVIDVLEGSAIDTSNIVALSGTKKEEPDEPSEPAATTDDEFPWLYVAIPIVAIAAAGAGIYAVRSKTTKPTTTKPGGTENHVTSYSTPSTDATAAKACGKSCTANCDLQCEGQCIALCERGVKGWDPNKKRGVPCSKACMGSCTFKCTTSCTADCTSWTQ